MGEREEKERALAPTLHGEFVFPCGERERNTERKRNGGEGMLSYVGAKETGERQTGVAEETLEKERLGRRGSWLTGVEEAGANEPSFTPVGR